MFTSQTKQSVKWSSDLMLTCRDAVVARKKIWSEREWNAQTETVFMLFKHWAQGRKEVDKKTRRNVTLCVQAVLWFFLLLIEFYGRQWLKRRAPFGGSLVCASLMRDSSRSWRREKKNSHGISGGDGEQKLKQLDM